MQTNIHNNIQDEEGGGIQSRPVLSHRAELRIMGLLWLTNCPSR